jgi:hypothetical protein
VARDVFISHSAIDKTIADAVCATLESRGTRCWIAPRDILPGQDWDTAIISGIKTSKVMVLLFSAHSNDSIQVHREVKAAFSKGVTVIPLRLDDVALSESLEFYLGSVHWLDAIKSPIERYLAQLAETVHVLLIAPTLKTLHDQSQPNGALDSSRASQPAPGESTSEHSEPAGACGDATPPSDQSNSRVARSEYLQPSMAIAAQSAVSEGTRADEFDHAGRDLPLPKASSPADALVATVSQSSPRFEARVWTERGAQPTTRDISTVARQNMAYYQIGEEFTLHVQSQCECYLTLIDIGTSGNAHLLLANHHLSSGGLQSLAGPDNNRRWQIGGPPGVERIRAFFMLDRLPLVGLEYRVVSLTTLNEICERIRAVSSDAWTDATCEFVISQ